MGSLRLIFVALFFSSLSPALAVDVQCDGLLGKYVGEGWSGSGGVKVSTYANHDNILFLSDGLKSSNHLSLGKIISNKYPEKKVVSTDFNYTGPEQIGSLRAVSVDNNRGLPFRDNEFDLVVLRYGLCVCYDQKCCGGFSPQSDEAQQFFFEVARILNRDNPQSLIILHGEYGVTPFILDEWKKFLRRVEFKYNVRATLYLRHDHWSEKFYTIGIRPGPPNTDDF